MEKSKPSEKTYVFTDFASLLEPTVPPLHEIWNWEGDKSVLPIKVPRIATCSGPM